MERNLGMDLVRATEAAALRSGRWMGRGDKNSADQAAVDAMRMALNSVPMNGIVVIGEGEKDEAPMLYIGERVGNGEGEEIDVAVDPVEGTTLLAEGMPGAIAIVAVAERHSFYNWRGIPYMDKLAVGERAKGVIDINAPVAYNIRAVARTLNKQVEDVTVVVLDRPRHKDLIRQIREIGARIKLIPHGDVSAGIMTSIENPPADILMGIGGAPEAVLTAAALKCLGGEIQCKVWPRNDEERARLAELGLDPKQVLTTRDLVRGENVVVAATGITSGEFLRGVEYFGGGARTHSVVMRSRSGTVRYIEATHRWDKLMRISDMPYAR
ncbi:MAG TPA: class II fructose-bisphosphatase [Chloroflexus aurantiacus]|jgi:fructose-1,6-bisphosphatase II|uniref:Fructose-1,6-bisphosphatase n=1 Tax=Chloroflexus aurantiacus (strain ATCC 29366 / DSM 635 / J-10-fl) TaxID=324602 RepID=A9WJ47_CHLAA|nr:class II fructose-bisphosphatase [Chloroflexus aurantiacus]ABY36506.1 fructose-1,6-bisphosphatase, class II [Chloroflexus aurantiacus J-10-fl]RMG52877.1 MAG: class II fructose-bisphosphatase [Chloroflexota bacterium]GIV94722.1 MAG: fructose-1,6-bisphosphatase [Chloroflexus sp.]HBW68947.1 class II fructose-bisphosphatase [Chloroflexus aurantiacus]